MSAIHRPQEGLHSENYFIRNILCQAFELGLFPGPNDLRITFAGMSEPRMLFATCWIQPAQWGFPSEFDLSLETVADGSWLVVVVPSAQGASVEEGFSEVRCISRIASISVSRQGQPTTVRLSVGESIEGAWCFRADQSLALYRHIRDETLTGGDSGQEDAFHVKDHHHTLRHVLIAAFRLGAVPPFRDLYLKTTADNGVYVILTMQPIIALRFGLIKDAAFRLVPHDATSCTVLMVPYEELPQIGDIRLQGARILSTEVLQIGEHSVRFQMGEFVMGAWENAAHSATRTFPALPRPPPLCQRCGDLVKKNRMHRCRGGDQVDEEPSSGGGHGSD